MTSFAAVDAGAPGVPAVEPAPRAVGVGSGEPTAAVGSEHRLGAHVQTSPGDRSPGRRRLEVGPGVESSQANVRKYERCVECVVVLWLRGSWGQG